MQCLDFDFRYPQMIHPLIVQFDSSATHQPDCSEQVGDFCLYFLRTAVGVHCQFTAEKIPKIMTNTHSTAMRIFALFMTFTLWLPFTFLGALLLKYSNTRTDAIIAMNKPFGSAKTAVAPSSATPAPEPAVTPVTSIDFDPPEAEITTDSSKWLTVPRSDAISGGKEVLVTIQNQLRSGGVSTVAIKMDETQFNAAAKMFQSSLRDAGTALTTGVPRGLNHLSIVISNKRWDIVQALFGNAPLSSCVGVVGDYIGPMKITLHRLPRPSEQDRKADAATALVPA